MLNNIKNELLTQTDSLLEYLDSLNLEPSTPFTEAEVQSIIAAETAQTQANYDRAVSQFQESNADSRSPQTRRFSTVSAAKKTACRSTLSTKTSTATCFRICSTTSKTDTSTNAKNLPASQLTMCAGF